MKNYIIGHVQKMMWTNNFDDLVNILKRYLTLRLQFIITRHNIIILSYAYLPALLLLIDVGVEESDTLTVSPRFWRHVHGRSVTTEAWRHTGAKRHWGVFGFLMVGRFRNFIENNRKGCWIGKTGGTGGRGNRKNKLNYNHQY